MNTLNHIYKFALISILAGSIGNAADMNVSKKLQIKEFKQTLTNPEGMKPFSTKQLNEFLQNWTEVKKKEFYYETAKEVIYPFQEGTLTFTNALKAKWRFYHCGGLRIEASGQNPRFFLPLPKEESKKPKRSNPTKLNQ